MPGLELMSCAECTNQLPHVQLCQHTGLRGLIKIGAENDAETDTALRCQLRYVDLNLFCSVANPSPEDRMSCRSNQQSTPQTSHLKVPFASLTSVY